MPVRFLHTADWQLGKPFARISGDIGARLRQARFDVVEKLAARANEFAADAILVAGDVFDNPFPDTKTLYAALNAMRGFTGPWVLLPGNHDPAEGNNLWARFAEMANGIDLHIALEPEPHLLADGRLAILPAPLRNRHGFDDPSAWMDNAQTPSAAIRVGLAHGSIREFGASQPSPNLIAPDRTSLAGLDYLALGDWHGLTQIDSKTWYAGTPEPDDFPSNDPGHALLVELDGPGSDPIVQTLDSRIFTWARLEIEVQAGVEDGIASVQRRIDEAERSDRLLLSLTMDGQIDLAGRAVLVAAVEDWQAKIAYLRFDDRLRDEPSEADLAALARGSGVVAATARRFIDDGDSEEARLALRHLYDMAMSAEA